MKKVFCGTLVLALLLAVFTCYAGATNRYSPFSKRDNNRGPVEAFYSVYNLEEDNPFRILFFQETLKNTGLTESIAKRVIDDGDFSTTPCGVFSLTTAGVTADMIAEYWRKVSGNEVVVYAHVNEKCIPWFLPPCVNPVKGTEVQRKAPPSTEATLTDCSSCGYCIPLGPAQYIRTEGDSIYYRIGDVMYEENSDGDVDFFQPMRCFN